MWTIGRVARETGVTVRTLRHYDEIGLLKPSATSPAGYRQYGREDVVRLQLIRSLAAMGFPLEKVGQMLRGTTDLRSVLPDHLARMRERLRQQSVLLEGLESLTRGLSSFESLSPDRFLSLIHTMTTMNQYFTPEQNEKIKAQGAKVGQRRIKEVENEWRVLIAQSKAAMEEGLDPAHERVQAIATKWMSLVTEFTGGDQGITAGLNRMYEERGDEIRTAYDNVPSREIMEYVSRAPNFKMPSFGGPRS